MNIIDIECKDTGDIYKVIEILNGCISEANAEFIKDVDEYSKTLNDVSDESDSVNNVSETNIENIKSKKKKKKKK